MPFANGHHVEKPEVAPNPSAALTHTEPHTDTDTAAIKQELAIAPYRDFFGDLGSEDKGKLEYILTQLNPEDTLPPEDVVAKIRRIDASFGQGDGEKRLEKVYRYLRMVNTVHEHILGGL